MTQRSFTRRLIHSASKDFGVQVPAGTAIRGWHLLLVAVLMFLIGIGEALAGQIVLVAGLWILSVGLVLYVLRGGVEDPRESSNSR